MTFEIKQKIEQCLEMIRPRLAMHGGNVEFVAWNADSGTVHVRFLGGCKGCPLSQMTLKMGIEALIQEWIPQVQEVVAVDE